MKNEMIYCEICGKEFKALTLGHLKIHGTDLKAYRKEYGESKTQTNTGRTHFKKGHLSWNTGKPFSEKIRQKISNSAKGRIAWNKDKNLSSHHRERLSEVHRGRKMPEEVRRKISDTLKGKRLTEERKRKISESLKGRKLSREWISKVRKSWFRKNNTPWNKGKNISEKTKKKISESLRGGAWVNDECRNKMKEIMQSKWKTEYFRKKFLEGMKKTTKITPNNLEVKMIDIMKKNNFPFSFVGNGNFWINGGGTSYNPDFIHNDKTQKKLIEIFGDFWHNKEDHKKRDVERIKTYKEKGFGVLVIWENQIKTAAEEVITKINKFLENDIQK